MKRIFSVSFLLLSSAIHANCPLPPSGYYFGMAGWGNHASDSSRVRCYYYHSNWTDQLKIDTDEYYHQSDLIGPRWNNLDRYSGCRSDNNNVSDCAFKFNWHSKN